MGRSDTLEVWSQPEAWRSGRGQRSEVRGRWEQTSSSPEPRWLFSATSKTNVRIFITFFSHKEEEEEEELFLPPLTLLLLFVLCSNECLNKVFIWV